MNQIELPVGGAVVYWSAGPTSLDLLRYRLERLGLEKHSPKPRTDAAALKLALKDYCESKGRSKRGNEKLVEPHKRQSKNGFEVVDVERDEKRNSYTYDFSATVVDGRVQVTGGYASTCDLQDLFDKNKEWIAGASVGTCLVSILAELEGTALRPSGGVYWIPDEAVETWERVAEAIEATALGMSENKVYVLRTVLNDQAIRAVRDAIVNEVTSAASALAEEVYSGTLGEEALENRKRSAMELHSRVSRYESILGEGLETLHQIIQTIENAASMAAMQSL